MTQNTNRQWRLKARPSGRLKESDFEWREEPVPPVAVGQVLVRTLYLSLDPTHRIWASDMDQYMPPVELGEVMRAAAIAEVVESKAPSLDAGDLVAGFMGWQDWTLVEDAQTLSKLPALPPGVPLTAFMGVLGHIGATAYFGVRDIGRPREGETMVVTSAGGAVGSIAGQIGKIDGCRVVGVTGTDEKCRWIVEELGFDAAINYKTENLLEALRRRCPGGIDIVFENVGGAQLDASLALINLNARIVLCGLIAQYNSEEPVPGPYRFAQLLMKRAKVEGFIVLDFWDRFPEALDQLGQWLAEGRLKYRVDVVDGVESAPTAVNKLFDGTNTGKLIVKVAEPSVAPSR